MAYWALASVHFFTRGAFIPPPPEFELDVSVTVVDTVTKTRASYLCQATIDAKMTDKQLAGAIADAVRAEALRQGKVIPTGNLMLFNTPTFL